MHNLFLGLVQFHFRTILGLDAFQATGANEFTGDEEEAEFIDPKQLIKARRIFTSSCTRADLSKLKICVLKALCEENGIDLPSVAKGEQRRKLPYILALLVSLSTSQESPLAHSKIEPVCDADGMPLVIGLDAVDDIIADVKTAKAKVSVLSKAEVEKMHKHIAETIRPVWNAAPPSNLGEAGHGKLKADEWRSTIEFDLPISLAQIWSGCEDGETSQDHVDRYMKYMKAYLTSLLELFPGLTLVPNHHNALHLGDVLLRFGPIHGSWMFPFERVIGALQKVNINSKMGELERTMVESFCAEVNVTAYLQRSNAPDVLAKCSKILESCCDKDQRGTLLTDIRSL
ncbi:hypothetical protein BD410DRAFT_708320, partial [Rickenella mellea]